MTVIPFNEILLRIGLSLVLGGVIGFERERDNQPAGLRTHMILVIGACLAMILSINMGWISGNDPANRRPGHFRYRFSVPAQFCAMASTSKAHHRHNTLDHGNRWARPWCRLLLGCHHFHRGHARCLAALDQIEKHVGSTSSAILWSICIDESVLREVRKTIKA